jgi:hypothetical protein
MVLRLRVPAPNDWRGAKCHLIDRPSRDYDPWFPPDDDDVELDEELLTTDMEEARDFCNGVNDGELCKLRDECLIFALTNNEKSGVWGGTLPPTRKLIRKRWPLRRGKIPRKEWRWLTHAEAEKLVAEMPEEAIIESTLAEQEDEWDE